MSLGSFLSFVVYSFHSLEIRDQDAQPRSNKTTSTNLMFPKTSIPNWRYNQFVDPPNCIEVVKNLPINEGILNILQRFGLCFHNHHHHHHRFVGYPSYTSTASFLLLHNPMHTRFIISLFDIFFSKMP